MRSGLQSRCKTCTIETARAWRLRHPDRHYGHQLKSKYGIDLSTYQRLLDRQAGGCAICGTEEPGSKKKVYLYVDHDHDTGRIRGLLCQTCNTAISLLQDHPELARLAAIYLDTH